MSPRAAAATRHEANPPSPDSAAVAAVRVVEDAWPEPRGLRAPGTGLPTVIAVGTRRGRFGKDYAAVHGKGPPAVVGKG